MFSRGVQFNPRPEPAGKSTDARGTSRREGGKVFGSGSRAPVAITIFVKNPNATHDGCKIHYRDIGDYLTREQKLEALTEAVSIKGISDWQAITPDKHLRLGWTTQRSVCPVLSTRIKGNKGRQADDAIFRLYSLGMATNRDAYIYNFSRDAVPRTHSE